MLRLQYTRLILLKRSQYLLYDFEPHLRTKINRVPRHDNDGEVLSSRNLLIFFHCG